MRWERLVLAAAMLLTLAMASCTTATSSQAGGEAVTGSGVMATDSRSLAAFSAVDLRALGNVIVEPGSAAAIRIEGEDNVVPIITTGVQQGRLVIAWKSGTGPVSATRPITYHLTAPGDLSELAVRGAGTIQLSAMRGDTLRLGVDGLGRITVNGVDATKLNVSITGAGQVVPSGRVDQQRLTIEGVGTYLATGLASRQTDVTIAGAGHAEVQVSGALNATLDGIGSVLYRGAPQVTRHGDGLGQVMPISGQ